VKAVFWIRHETEDKREGNLARAIQAGAHTLGDVVEIREVPDDGIPDVVPCDLVLKIGVKSRNWFRAYNQAGIPYCYFDKGYIRTRAMVWLEYWRLSVNGHQPLEYVKQKTHDSKRAKKMGLSFQPWRTKDRGDAILVDGSSGKHHYFHADRDYTKAQMGELHEDANQIAISLVQRIRHVSPQRHIIYRPKPSWKFARQISGTEFSGGKEWRDVMARAHVCCTYGSNLCFDAALFGVPSIVLGHGIAGPISSKHIEEIENPVLVTDAVRQQWLNNVAWTQFHALDEFENGMAWKVIREMVDCTPIQK
jgi:hypothetical protein